MSCVLRWFSRRRFFDFDGASASALHRLAWKRLSGKILSRPTGPAPCWMTKPAPPARLALFGTGPFRRLRHEPGVRRSDVRRRAALSAHGMSSSPVPAPQRATGRVLGAVRTREPLRGIPAKEPSCSGYDGRRFCDADVCVVPFPILRQRRRGQSGGRCAATAASTIRIRRPGTRTGTPATACAGRPLAALESSGPERFRFPAASSGARGNDHASKYC